MDDISIIELYHRREEQAISETDKKYGGMCRSIAFHLLGLKEDAEECLPSPDTVETSVEHGALADSISAWLDTLKGTERWLFVRRYWYADPVKDLAAQLHEPPNTCSQRLHRLRRDLRLFLESQGMDV